MTFGFLKESILSNKIALVILSGLNYLCSCNGIRIRKPKHNNCLILQGWIKAANNFKTSIKTGILLCLVQKYILRRLCFCLVKFICFILYFHIKVNLKLEKRKLFHSANDKTQVSESCSIFDLIRKNILQVMYTIRMPTVYTASVKQSV